MYHCLGIREQECTRIRYEGGKTIFEIRTKESKLYCPKCKSRHVIRSGSTVRQIKCVPVDDILEGQEVGSIVTVSILLKHVNGLTLTVYHHQAALVAMIHFLHATVFVLKDAMGRFQGHLILRQLEFKL